MTTSWPPGKRSNSWPGKWLAKIQDVRKTTAVGNIDTMKDIQSTEQFTLKDESITGSQAGQLDQAADGGRILDDIDFSQDNCNLMFLTPSYGYHMSSTVLVYASLLSPGGSRRFSSRVANTNADYHGCQNIRGLPDANMANDILQHSCIRSGDRNLVEFKQPIADCIPRTVLDMLHITCAIAVAVASAERHILPLVTWLSCLLH